MTTFDGWEEQLYGYRLSYGQDSLAHFRTKGSKNGVRRFQNEDGSWTPLGLKERKAREGWGEKRAERKKERISRLNARRERIRKPNVKNMTDAELEKKIARAKLEMEYKELTRSPAVKAGISLVHRYLKYKESKALAEKERRDEMRKNKQLEINATNAKASLIKAKADKIGARKKARADFLKAKTERSKNTIRGAISSTLGNIIRKEGSRTVNGMSNDSLVLRGANKVKTIFRNAVKSPVEGMTERMMKEQKKRQRENPFKG